MKKIYFNLLTALMLCASSMAFGQSDIIITGILDGPLPGGLPKALEIYVVNDVADLSAYGIANANNGGASNGAPIFTFPADAVTAGDFIYLGSEADLFEEYMGFAPTYDAGGAMGVNGDDVIELYLDGAVVDYFGEIEVDGSGTPWEYLDGWAYRVNGAGPNTTFTIAEWILSGINSNDGQATNETATLPWPIGTYSTEPNATVEATIPEIQETTDPNGESPLVGQTVMTSGIVTAVNEDGFWLQDGMGEWTGIFIRQDDPTAAQGDDITLTGVVQESNGLTRINNVEDLTVNSSANPLPMSTVLSTLDAGTEPYESVLIAVENAVCLDPDLGFGEWLVNDGSGPLRVDDAIYEAAPIQFATYDITGVLTFSFSNFKVLPRDENDIVLINEPTLAVSFPAEELSFDETDGTVSVDVFINNPLDISTSLEVAVVGGTAVNGEHYNFTSPAMIMFPASSSDPQSFSFDIIDDAMENEDRTIIFEIQNAENNAIISIGTLTVTIDDDDAIVVITDIAIVAETDADGAIVNEDQPFTIAGVVYGNNMRLTGLSFTVRDQTGGIGIFAPGDVDGYVPAEGDSVVITGLADQFNGLAQLSNLESIELISQGNPISEPVLVTSLSEDTESQLIRIDCVSLLDPGQWSNSGSGFNVTVTNGTDEYAMRIVNAIDLYGATPPLGSFEIIGIGGQFDSSSPFLDGYQIFPRSAADIIECGAAGPPENDECADATDLSSQLGGPVGIPIPSDVVTNENATSVDDPNPNDVEDDCWFGTPLLAQTVWFTFTGDGSTYFIETANCAGVVDYIDNGDTQMAVFTGDCGNLTQVACNEDGPQSSENDFAAGLDLQTEDGVVYYIMIDGYEDAQGQFCMQFTAQAPDAVGNVYGFDFEVYPNPSNDRMFVETREVVEAATLTNILGQEVRAYQFGSSERLELNVNGLDAGIYILQLRTSDNAFSTAKVVVE